MYYWRAGVNNCDFSQAGSFTIAASSSSAPVTYVYPNPFRPADGNPATFSDIPANSELLIMTVSGDLVKHWLNTDGDDIVWNGTNSNGDQVSSGVYLWFVGTSGVSGKLIVVR